MKVEHMTCRLYRHTALYSALADRYVVNKMKAKIEVKGSYRKAILETSLKNQETDTDAVIRNPRDLGVPLEVIVSLTSYPARIKYVDCVIKNLRSQTIRADKIILWLAKEQFPNGLDSLPEELLAVIKDNVEIRWCQDLKSHKKYYYTMLENPESIVITVDDDINYPVDLIEKLLESYMRFPFAVSAVRAYVITYNQDGSIAPYLEWKIAEKAEGIPSYSLFATGVAGILYPPRCMCKELFNQESITELCLRGDDLWLKVMQVINGTPVVKVDIPFTQNIIQGTQTTTLWEDNKYGGGNDNQLHNILEKYDSFLGDKDTVTHRILVSSKSFSKMISGDLLMTKSSVSTNDNDGAEKTLNCNHFRMDGLFSWILHRISSGVKCYREHGWNYVIERLLANLKPRKE